MPNPTLSPWMIATGESLVRVEVHEGTWHAQRIAAGRKMRCLASDPQRLGVSYAGSRGEGIWTSPSAGQQWMRLDFPEPDVFSLAISPADGALYAGTEPSRLFVSRDEGRAWDEVTALQDIPSRPTWSFPPRPWTSHIRAIAPSPHDARVLLVGIELGGIMRTEDGGKTWHDHPPGAQKDVHALAWHPHLPRRAYEAGGGGAAWSHDGGVTWTPADAGRDRHYTWALAVDPDDPDQWYLSANPGARLAHQDQQNADACLYRWRGDGPWEAIGTGLPRPLESLPYALAVHDGAVFAALRDGRVYRSDDHGDHWTQVPIVGEAPSRIMAWTAPAPTGTTL